MAIIINGKQIATDIKHEILQTVRQGVKEKRKPPHLAAILVGDDSASESYIKNKMQSCDEVGFRSTVLKRKKNVSQGELLELIEQLNTDNDIDGYIVQLPLPSHIDADRINLAIDPAKDVDGFHPFNLGKMMIGMPTYLPATPYGIIQILEHHDIETSGKHAVIIGRSQIVGTPMNILLSRKMKQGNATVTMVHSRTQDVKFIIRQADIIIAAIGKARFVTADMVKDGAVVIDVGINRIKDDSRKSGYRLVGDVDFDEVMKKASYITPVPGGVGPMTVCSLLLNTLKAWNS